MITNQEVIIIFETIAKILSIQGENVFKIRAYQKAVQTIEGLGRELSKFDEKEEIRSLSGIGEAIYKKIIELLETGRLEYYEKLLKTDHAHLVEFLNIPGMGPKHTRLVYDKLNISTLSDLKKAAEQNKLRTLPGLGEKVERKILGGIISLEKYKERRPIKSFHFLVENIVNELKQTPHILQIAVAGSIRRMKETIADGDILVSSPKPDTVIERFTSLPRVSKILQKGQTKASIQTLEGFQVDLRVVNQESFGAALHYFTGSKAHNIQIRALANEQGLKVNEYGVFKNDQRIAGESEAEIFTALNLPFIPPELREDQGEIEASMKQQIPKLIERKDMAGDLHMHTTWSDGRSTLEEMAEAAKDLGYRYISICDHSPFLGITNGLDPERLKDQGEKIDALNARYKNFTILKGIEVDILEDGSLDLPDETLKNLDIVVASVHSRFSMSESDMTKRVIRAAKHPLVNVIAHPTGRLIGRREPYKIDILKVIDACKTHGTALELNAHPDRLDLKDTYLKLAKEKKVKIAINSDSHETKDLKQITFGIGTAKRGWLTKEDVINTLPLPELKRWIALKKDRFKNQG